MNHLLKGKEIKDKNMQLDYNCTEISFLDICKFFLRQKKVFNTVFLISIFFGVIIYFLIPTKYSVIQDINLPYSYGFNGAIYYPLKSDGLFWQKLVGWNNDISSSEYKYNIALYDKFGNLVDMNLIHKFGIKNLLSNQLILHRDFVKEKDIPNAKAYLRTISSDLIRNENKSLKTTFGIASQYEKVLDLRLRMVSSYVNQAKGVSSAYAIGKQDVTPIDLWMNSYDSLQQQKSIIQNWHGFSLGSESVLKKSINFRLEMFEVILCALGLALLASLVSEIKSRLAAQY